MIDHALPTGPRGRLLALAITLLALALLWFGAVSPLLDWYAGREEALRDRAAYAARLEALATTLPALQRQAAQAATAGKTEVLVLAGADDAIAGAALQGQVESMAHDAGATLASVETLPVEQVGRYRRIGVGISVNAPWAVLVRLIRAVEQATPPMFVDNLQIESDTNGQMADPPLQASLSVLAFRTGAAPAGVP